MFIKNYSDTDLVIKYKGNEKTLESNDVTYISDKWITLAMVKAMFGNYVEEVSETTPIEEFLFDEAYLLDGFNSQSYDFRGKCPQSMFKKKAVIVSTAAGTGTKSAMKDIEDCLFYLGVPRIYKFGMSVQAMSWDGVSADKKQKISKMSNKLAQKLGKNGAPAVGIKTRFMFWMMGMMQKKGWNSSPIETQYWKERGWLDGKKPWN